MKISGAVANSELVTHGLAIERAIHDRYGAAKRITQERCMPMGNNKGSRWGFGLLAGMVAAQVMAVEFKQLPTEAWSAVIPSDKHLAPEWERSLFERGALRSYTGDALMNIGMPVGGITAGLVYLGGDGKLWNWDVFNRRLNGVKPRQIQYKDRKWFGHKGIAVWLGGNYVEPVRDQPCAFQQGFAIQLAVDGREQIRTLDLKGWKNVVFNGSYPFGSVSYSDPDCPVKVVLEAYSPFCPLNYDDSSLPATLMSYRVENNGTKPVAVKIGGWLENPVLIDTIGKYPGFLRTNTVTSRDGTVMLVSRAAPSAGKPSGPDIVSKERPASPHKEPDWGSMALAAIGGGSAGGSAQLEPVPVRSVFASGPATASSPRGKPLVGGVTRSLTLAPGSTGTAKFVVAWHFVNVSETVKGAETGLYYGKRFKDAEEVVAYVAANAGRLDEITRLWRTTWYDSTLPYWFLERTLIPLDCLASTTCFRFANGRFYTYEGVRSCAGHPNHVWHYAQAHARLFPELEQDVIERVWYGFGFHPDGSMAYRGEIAGGSAMDGHCGVILSVLRAHQTNPDDRMLRRLWPRVKRSIEYANACDSDGDGLLDKPMLTTLDEPWHGQIPWISSLYIAALKAGEQMASEMGDTDFAQACRGRADKGRAAMDAKLFNGEWFVQIPDPRNPKKLGAYETCHIDQVMGQGWAWQVGLGRVLSEDTTRSALRSLWKYNFARNLDAYDAKADPKGRPYYTDGEGGLVMTANALGREQPFGVYSGFACYLNETMNGFEYQAAAHMIAEGLVKEGLAVLKTVDERYDGNKRNPFDEIECGDHYARSMAGYGAFIAACGYEYHGPKGFLAFAPRIHPEKFKAAFTAAEGWGTYEQCAGKSGFTSRISLKYGKLKLKTVSLAWIKDQKPGVLKVSLNGQEVAAGLKVDSGMALITLADAVVMMPGQDMEINLAAEQAALSNVTKTSEFCSSRRLVGILFVTRNEKSDYD